MTIEKIDYTTNPHPSGVVALSLKDAPALIESLFPVQKISVESYKEQMAVHGKMLTALGSYWKGRKPLVLNRACVLASLLPATNRPLKDLEVFELLMGMDDISLSKRLGLAKPIDILQCVHIPNIDAYFTVTPASARAALPTSAPFSVNDYVTTKLKVEWRSDVSDSQKHVLSAQLFAEESYKEVTGRAKRTDELHAEELQSHIWARINEHVGTKAYTIEELTEQLGVMRFGHRPTIADTFSGSGQIPFAAAQTGCDVYASDLNPISCMLSWGAFNVVGASVANREIIHAAQKALVQKVKRRIDALEVETDGNGWRGRAYLYCIEVECPSSGWRVPVLPTLIVNKKKSVVAQLIPDVANKRYEITLKSNASAAEMRAAEKGTYSKGNVTHRVDGVEHINSISSIRGDYSETIDCKRVNKNKLRHWGKNDVIFQKSDIFNERLYAIQWIKDNDSARPETEFRSVTNEDLAREEKVIAFVQENLAKWQANGWVPDMRIETGVETERLYRERGWTHWHHLFNPRQLTVAAFIREEGTTYDVFGLTQLLNRNSRLSHWDFNDVKAVFYNQALNTFFNYGCRGFVYSEGLISDSYKSSPFAEDLKYEIVATPAEAIDYKADIFITDPPYGDAVKYEEILDFFIAWLHKNPPAKFAGWVWDSRRELAVKGEDHDFKLSMVAAYSRMAESMPDNGLQIVMFTHQDGNIWADMANIVLASGLRVSAAWYIVTETDSALRDGSYVKGTILLILRKRNERKRTNQSDLSYEIEEEVAEQVKRLTGLNSEFESSTKRIKDGNLFEDADLQMAGYAAALKVLTKYSVIDGKDMAQEALRPRIVGQKLLVDELIDFAVDTANKALVPHGLEESLWHGFNPAERFYLKMLDMESRGLHSLDNYQNFAKAFSVRGWQAFMGSDRANEARLRSAVEFGRAEMAEGSELFNTSTRAVLYSLMELQAEKDIDDVLAGLPHNLPNYYSERQTVAKLAAYIAKKVEESRPAEASAARILAAAIDNQRL